MKYLFLSLLIAAVLPMTAKAHVMTQEEIMCQKAAQKVANVFFDKYVEDTKKQMESELEPGDVLNPEDLPGGLESLDSQDNVFSFGWGERQECSCGMDVKTKVSKDRKSCSGKVVDSSVGCDCG